MSTPILGSIGQISHRVRDIDTAISWYRDVLGLPHLYTYGDIAFFDVGGTRLFLSAVDEDGHSLALMAQTPPLTDTTT